MIFEESSKWSINSLHRFLFPISMAIVFQRQQYYPQTYIGRSKEICPCRQVQCQTRLQRPFFARQIVLVMENVEMGHVIAWYVQLSIIWIRKCYFWSKWMLKTAWINYMIFSDPIWRWWLSTIKFFISCGICIYIFSTCPHITHSTCHVHTCRWENINVENNWK